GPANSPRAYRLRDDLARAGVPYWSFDDSSEEGRRLLREHDLEGTPLPVVLARDGTVLVDPSHEDLLATLGLPSALGTRACDVAIIGAGPAGWRPRSTRRPRDSQRWCWIPNCPVGRPARVP